MISIKKNFVYNLLLTVSTILFPIVSFPYASRILGPEGIGKVQFVTTFAQYFVLIAAFGIPIYGLREVAKVKDDKHKLSKLFSELLLINLVSTIFILIIYFLIIYLVGFFSNDLLFYLIGAIIIFFSFTSVDWLFSGIEEFRYITLRSLVIKAISVIALFVFVKTREDLLTYLIITIFSISGNNIWNFFHLSNRITFLFKNLNFKRHLPVLLTLFITSMATSIYTVMDTLFLGFLSDDMSVGFYTAAIKLNKIAIPVIVSLGIVLIPKITQSMTLKDGGVTLQELTNRSFSFICLLGVPMSAGLGIYAPEIMLVFSGPEFIDAVPTMRIASPLILLIGFGHLFGLQLLIPSGNEKWYLFATILGMILSVILNIILIRLLKDKGAAAATLLGELVVSFVSYYFVCIKLRIKFDWRLAFKAFLSSLIFVPIAFFLRNFQIDNAFILIIAVIISSFSYFIIQAFLFRENLIRTVFAKYFVKF
ncbi:MAG: flippase [Pyrinomonadaceae bacterium]|nr:flippase [Sphingobacteriaceae bacterium]